MSFEAPSDPMTAKALNTAVRYLAPRARSVDEIKQYLARKNFDEACIDQAVQILIERHYLDDLKFARLFVDSRARHNPKSTFLLSRELKSKGISRDIIHKALDGLDDQVLAMAAVNRKIKLWRNIPDREAVRKKCFNYLRYRGFAYHICMEVWDSIKNFENQNE